MAQNWLMYSLFVMLGTSSIHLILKKLGSKLDTRTILFYLVIIQTAIFGFIIYSSKISLLLDRFSYLLIITAAALAVIADICIVNAINLAPNPGYHTSIGSSGAALIAILSVFLFNSELSFIKIIGILLVILGASLISYDRKIHKNENTNGLKPPSKRKLNNSSN